MIRPFSWPGWRAARRGILVGVLEVGDGARPRAPRWHSVARGRLPEATQAYEALFDRHGVIRVESEDELCGHASSPLPPKAARRGWTRRDAQTTAASAR